MLKPQRVKLKGERGGGFWEVLEMKGNGIMIRYEREKNVKLND
jgi:hypothetical protein